MLRRHDFNINISGGFAAAMLTSDYITADGITLPATRRLYTRGPDRRPVRSMLMVNVDFSEVEYQLKPGAAIWRK